MSRSTPALAPLIPYYVPYLPSIYSVEGALDYLFYRSVAPTISVTPSLVEVGVTVTSVILNWNVSREPSTSIEITDVPTVTTSQISDSATLSSLSLTTNKTYSITVTDQGNATSGSATLSFLFKNYYGASTATSLNNATVLSLEANDFRNTRAGDYSFTGLSNTYVHIAFPTSYGAPVFRVNGLIVTFTLQTISDFVNASGGSTSYQIYRSSNLLNGSVLISIS